MSSPAAPPDSDNIWDGDKVPIEDTSTYPAPIHGWCCFHCGENFTTVGAARDHFGGNIYDTPGCMIRVQVGEERGLLMELRKAQAEVERLRRDIEDEVSSERARSLWLSGMLAQYKPFLKCWTVQDVFNVYDSMEGRALAAEGARTHLLKLLFDVAGNPDHMTHCDRTMGATHPCTCGANEARRFLGVPSRRDQ